MVSGEGHLNPVFRHRMVVGELTSIISANNNNNEKNSSSSHNNLNYKNLFFLFCFALLGPVET